MLIRVLGSAAGGGFPQWNCGCPNCRGVRDGSVVATPRSQASVAVSADGDAWFLLGASPEIRAQIEACPALHPREPRHSPIAGVLLANGDLDHCLGLFSLRESHPIRVYATPRVREGLTQGNTLYRTLERFPGQTRWTVLVAGREVVLTTADGEPSGLVVEAIPAPGKVPLHLDGLQDPSPGDNVGFLIREPARDRTLAYFPSVGGPSEALIPALERADIVFFDGTFWSSDELVALGLGARRAEDMAHWPLGGPEGSLKMLAGLSARRRVLIHINNTNPILRDDSEERRALAAAEVEVAWDGMELDA